MPEPAPTIRVIDLAAAIDTLLTATEGSAVAAPDGSWARITAPNGRTIELRVAEAAQ